MIIEEYVSDTLIRHYSNENYYIKQLETDFLYVEAIDIIPCRYTYTETDIPIEEPEQEESLNN